MNSESKLASNHNDENRRRPGPATPDFKEDASLRQLARRVEKTYLSRLKMAQRLQNRGTYWSAALVGLAVTSTIASLSLLFRNQAYGPHGDVLLVIVGVFTLVASLTVANADYPGKARRGFETYRQLQRLSVQLAAAAKVPPIRATRRRKAYLAFDHLYQNILDESDNHSAADYGRAIRFSVQKDKRKAKNDPAKVQPSSAPSDLVSRPEFVLRWIQILGSSFVTLLPIALSIGAILFALPALIWTVSGLPS